MPQDQQSIDAARAFTSSGPKQLYVGGAWSAPRAGSTLDVIDPSTELVLCPVGASDPDDVNDAVAAAQAAFEDRSWSSMGPHVRARYLLRIADLIGEHCAELAAISSLEMGMPFASSMLTTTQMIDVFQYYAGWVTKSYGKTIPDDGTGFTFTLREPLGVVAVIIPWNGPILYTSWKIAVALAAGNTVVLKPAEDAPLTCVRFAEILEEADLPNGVFNLITGPGASVGDALVSHPAVKMITFTGSTAVGQHIMETGAKTLKKLSLELGGKSPFVVFPDAEMDSALSMAAQAFTQNAGQACTAGTRLYIHESVFDEAVNQIAKSVSQLVVGGPFDDDTEMGPIISDKQIDRVSSYVDSARKDGATIVTGGARRSQPGYFYEPTVITDVTNNMKVVREEIFGPVGCIMPFSSEEDVLEKANSTEYGLAASIWTTKIATAQTMSRSIRAGMVWVNTHFELDVVTPFGGYKNSGVGRELGAESVDEFSQVKSILTKGL